MSRNYDKLTRLGPSANNLVQDVRTDPTALGDLWRAFLDLIEADYAYHHDLATRSPASDDLTELKQGVREQLDSLAIPLRKSMQAQFRTSKGSLEPVLRNELVHIQRLMRQSGPFSVEVGRTYRRLESIAAPAGSKSAGRG